MVGVNLDVSAQIPWPMSVHSEFTQFTPVTGRIESHWIANCRLSLLTFDIIEKLFAVGKGSISDANQVTEALDLERILQTWKNDLPAHIGLGSRDTIENAVPYKLGLHMQWECARIALQYPFINLQEISAGSLSLQALQKAIESSKKINDLAGTYIRNFSFTGAMPFLSHQIFCAGTVWVAASSIDPQNATYALALKQTMCWLDKLKSTWPAAIQHFDLLQRATKFSS